MTVCFLSDFLFVGGDQKFASVFDCGVERRRLIKTMKLFPAFRKVLVEKSNETFSPKTIVKKVKKSTCQSYQNREMSAL